MTITNLKMLRKFTSLLFPREDQAWKAAMIIQGILKAPRITEVARAIPKPFFAGHKMIYRFLKKTPLKEALLRMFHEDAPFVICDPTEIPRPQAKRTPYVGRLKDGKTRGFQLLVFSFPYKGRAIPFWFVAFSSRTISREETSRNLVHLGAFLQVKELLGERPWSWTGSSVTAGSFPGSRRRGSTSLCASRPPDTPPSPTRKAKRDDCL